MVEMLTPLKTRSRRKFVPNSQINVTPLVDVMLVLLVIFMVTAPMLTVGVAVNLPKTNASQMNDQTEPLVVTINAKGEIYLQETLLDEQSLIKKLRLLMHKNKEAKIYVRGDESISYGRIMETMGVISQAGFQKVSLIAEMPTESKRNVIEKPLNKQTVTG
ncbi:MAG TPA: protein TolR [Holosporales bacterium]|nr:protein TolR [Holosporales bacterium]